jgi:hypothetical protein
VKAFSAICASLLWASIACQSSAAEPPAPPARATAPAPRPPDNPPPPAVNTDAAVQIAEKWLDALERRSLAELTTLSAAPFVLHDPKPREGCGTRTAKETAELASTLQCLADNKLLIEDLVFKLNHPHVAERVADDDFPKWSKRWRKEIAREMVPVGFYIIGAGLEHDIILLVEDGHVRAFWRSVKYDAH